MTQQVAGGTNPLAKDLDTFINVYMRQHTIWFTCAHQELYQIDEQLRNTLLSLGMYILGGTSSMESARTLADALFSRDPWWVKYWRPVYEPRPYWARSRPDDYEPPKEPEFMPLEEQTELFAQRIKNLGRFQFLLRPAVAEGHIGSAVVPLSIRHEDIDKATGKYQFPDSDLIHRLRAALAKQSGIPIARLLAEQESRVPQALPVQPMHLMPAQPRQLRSQTNGHRIQHHTRLQPPAQEDRQPPAESVPAPVSPPEPSQPTPERTVAVKTPAALRRRHRIA
jgi:hypothetical protein